MTQLIKTEIIAHKIFIIRDEKVILDRDLAELYGVTTKRLNEQVQRNRKRFPKDFLFRLNNHEVTILRSQFATSRSWGGRRNIPLAFTEHGAIMAASVLNTSRAIEMSVFVVRAFIRIRDMLRYRKELSQKLDQLEKKVSSHDVHIRFLFETIRQLMMPPKRERKKIGF